jgi:hypothetical protein
LSEYRQIDAKNYSTLSTLDEGPWKLNQHLDTKAFSLGSSVDILLFDGEKEYKKQIITTELKEPTATLSNLINYCYDNNLNENWMIQQYVNEKDEDGNFKIWKTSKKLDVRDNNWNTDYFHSYLDYLRSSKGKIRLTIDEDLTIHNAVKYLKTSDFTKNIFNDKRGTSQMVLVKDIKGMKFKGKLDWVIIDEKSKTIYPYDLKTTSKYLNSFKYSVLKYRYDIQSSLYTNLLQVAYPEYVIADFRMIVYSFPQRSANVFNLKKYKEISKQGFVRNEELVKGWLELAHELDWHNENQLFDHNMETYLNNGEIIL